MDAVRTPAAQGKDSRDIRSMFDRIAPTYDRLNRLMTVGIDRGWRKAAAREIQPGAKRVLDLCAGTLDFADAVESVIPGAQVIGADFAVEMLRLGQSKLPHVPRVGADALRLPFAAGSFDAAVCGFGVRNLTSLEAGLAELHRVLRPGGTFVILELFRAERALTRAFHSLYNRQVLPTMGALLSTDGTAYRYLADSMERFVTRREMAELMERCGWVEVRSRDLTLGVTSIVAGVRP